MVAALFILLLSISSVFAAGAYKRICFHNVCLMAEVADTDTQRLLGLMFRKSLHPRRGMLFVFDREDTYTFWMKNMLIPLDIIWISEDKQIVDIKTDALPCNKSACENFIPKQKVQYVLEVNAGFVKKYNIKITDQIRF